MPQESPKPQSGQNVETGFSPSPGSAVAPSPSTQHPAAQQPATHSPRPCPQDCSLCPIQQQVFCSTKMLFDLSRAHQETRQQLASLTTALDEAAAAISSIQSQLHPQDGETPLSTPLLG